MSDNPPHPSEAKKRECFVLSPIGQENSTEREIADQVYEFILTPVVEDNGYTIDRADKIYELGQIPTQIVQRIYTSDLVIADLTGYNPNVFYELAIRHFTKKPVVQIILKEEKIPFDNSQTRTIYYDLSMKGGNEAKKQLDKLLKSSIDEEIENPISTALASLKLKQSNIPEQQITAEIFDKLQSLDNRLSMIQNQMVRQASDNPFNPTNELFSYDEGRERSKELAKHIINQFRHSYNIEGNVEKEKKEKKR